jgi:hypothetical protein
MKERRHHEYEGEREKEVGPKLPESNDIVNPSLLSAKLLTCKKNVESLEQPDGSFLLQAQATGKKQSPTSNKHKRLSGKNLTLHLVCMAQVNYG